MAEAEGVLRKRAAKARRASGGLAEALQGALAAEAQSLDAQVAAAGGQADTIMLLNRYLKSAASLLGADRACILLGEAGMARAIARYNIPHAFLVTDRTVDTAPYKADERVLLNDCSAKPELHAFLGALAGPTTGCFYRRPLSRDDVRMISLLIYGEKPRPPFAARDLALVEEIAAAMTEEVERHYPSRFAGLARSLSMTRAEIDRWLEATDAAVLLLDGDLTVRAANARLRGLLPLPWEAVLGKAVAALDMPGRDAIDRMFRHALATGMSTPRLDVAIDAQRMLSVVGSPVKPIDGEPLLVATLDPASLPAAAGDAAIAAADPMGEPASEFLLETLVRRRALRSRNGVSYVTLRSWRQPIREHQIRALRALKRHAPQAIAAEIAGEVAEDVGSLFGAGGFRAVVPMPCGHSSEGRCLSAEIARALGQQLSLPVAHALVLPKERGSSHPKANVKRAAMRLAAPVEGPVLLVDDVATSGRHIEEASQLLRAAGSGALAVAWIGGDG
jgi:predicted amidophosphoribosyltransferase